MYTAEALIGISRKLNLVPEGGYGFSLVLRLPPAGSKGKTLGHFLLELFFVDTKKSGNISLAISYLKLNYLFQSVRQTAFRHLGV